MHRKSSRPTATTDRDVTEPANDQPLRAAGTGPSYQHEDGDQTPERSQQVPLDLIDEESMESFPCSDPPGHYACHV